MNFDSSFEKTVKFAIGFSNAQIQQKLNPVNGGQLGYKECSRGLRTVIMFTPSRYSPPILKSEFKFARLVTARQLSPLTSRPASGKFPNPAGADGAVSFPRVIKRALKWGENA